MAITKVTGSVVGNVLDNISALLSADPSGEYSILGYHTAGDGGGGVFYWDSLQDKANHNGGTIIDPDITFPGTWSTGVEAGVVAWFTPGTGTGCWMRVFDGPLNVRFFGAKLNGSGVPPSQTGTQDHLAIQKALDVAYGDGTKVYPVYVPPGMAIIGDTLYLPQIVDFYGAGVSIFTALSSTRLQAKAGLEKDMIRVKPNLFSTYWWAGRVRDMDIRGDGGTTGTGTVGHGISLRDSSGNIVTAQDGALFNNLIIENIPDSGIHLPAGSVPLHIRDVRVTDCGSYGVEYIQGVALQAHSFHLDNLSGDLCTSGLVLLQNCDHTSNIVITNIKSETSAASQTYTIIADNCDRTAIHISGGHTTYTIGTAPKDFIRITGAGCPVIKWDAYNPRTLTSDADVPLSYVLNDTITGRVIPSRNRFGMYNTIAVRRASISGATINAGAGSNATIDMSGSDEIALGTLVAASQVSDMADVLTGQAYTDGTNILFRRQNLSGSNWTYADSHLVGFKVPDNYVKARSIAAAYNPASLANNTSTSTTVTVPGATLGDFTLYTHATDQLSTVGTSYVSAADTVTVHWSNASGPARDIGSADLVAYVLKESAFSGMGGLIEELPSIANGAQYVVPETINVPGAAIGDVVLASFSLDLSGLKISAYVSAADTVEVIFANWTGAPVDLSSGTIRVGVLDKDGMNIMR